MTTELDQASTKELDKALLAAQAECHKVVKNEKNPFHKSTYANLEAVRDATQPALEKHGLLFSSMVGGTGLICRISHPKSGKYREWVSPYFMDKPTPQALGSCVTYLRRYNLLSLLNLAPEDDDANEASGKQTTASVQAPKKRVELYEARPAQKTELAVIFSKLKVEDAETKRSINTALINQRCKMDELEQGVIKLLDKIVIGEELEIPFGR